MPSNIIAREKVSAFGTEFDVTLCLESYADGNQALVAYSGYEPFGKLSVNITEGAPELKPNQFFIKTWSENEFWYRSFKKYFDFKGSIPLNFVNVEIWELKTSAV